MFNHLAALKYDTIYASIGECNMKSELSANQALANYNQKEWKQRQAWAKVLAAPAKPTQRRPVKQGFFSRFFKVV